MSGCCGESAGNEADDIIQLEEKKQAQGLAEMGELEVPAPTNSDDPSGSYPGRYWHPVEDGARIHCDLCPRACVLKDGDRGFCFVRQNKGGQMILTTYGLSTGFCVDPIEKKPLNHFLPGTSVLSFGTAGCNLGCRFCQNWSISKSREVAMLSEHAGPEQVADAALKLGCKSVAFTYNDPVIWAEYAIDCAKACHERGLKTVAVTAGYITPEAREEFYSYMDAANVDLKAFTEIFYQHLSLAHLEPVLDTLKWLKHESSVWFEITNLMIPEENDSPEETEKMCDWIVRELGCDVPVHFTAFHPDFKLMNRPPTPPATLARAREQALAAGIKYAYVGNVYDIERQSTYCPKCEEVLIERDWFELGTYRLKGNACSLCGAEIAGVFESYKGNWGRRRLPVVISEHDVQPGFPGRMQLRGKGNGWAVQNNQGTEVARFGADGVSSGDGPGRVTFLGAGESVGTLSAERRKELGINVDNNGDIGATLEDGTSFTFLSGQGPDKRGYVLSLKKGDIELQMSLDGKTARVRRGNGEWEEVPPDKLPQEFKDRISGLVIRLDGNHTFDIARRRLLTNNPSGGEFLTWDGNKPSELNIEGGPRIVFKDGHFWAIDPNHPDLKPVMYDPDKHQLVTVMGTFSADRVTLNNGDEVYRDGRVRFRNQDGTYDTVDARGNLETAGGTRISADGQVRTSDGKTFNSRGGSAQGDASVIGSPANAATVADAGNAAAAAVEGKPMVDFNDVGRLADASGNIGMLIATCMASGDMDSVTILMAAQGRVDGALSYALGRAQACAIANQMGVFSPSLIEEMQHNIYGKTPLQAAEGSLDGRRN